MAMENNPFEDVFPIEHGDFPFAMLVYRRVNGDYNKLLLRILIKQPGFQESKGRFFSWLTLAQTLRVTESGTECFCMCGKDERRWALTVKGGVITPRSRAITPLTEFTRPFIWVITPFITGDGAL